MGRPLFNVGKRCSEGMSDPDPTDMGDLFDELTELEDLVQTSEAREQVRETMRVAVQASQNTGTFGRLVRGFGREDLAEALLGSVLFGIPMVVEGGTQEVGAFLATRPVILSGTVLFTFGLVIGIIYVADIQDVRIHDPLFGVIPRRLVGVFGVALVTALVLMTAWGRVNWGTPLLAMADVAVAFVPMSIGAALGDILPGT